MIEQTHQEWRRIYQLQHNKYKGNGKPAQEKPVISLSMIIQHAIIPMKNEVMQENCKICSYAGENIHYKALLQHQI